MARNNVAMVATSPQISTFDHPRRLDDTGCCTFIDAVSVVNKQFIFVPILYSEWLAFVVLNAMHICNLYATKIIVSLWPTSSEFYDARFLILYSSSFFFRFITVGYIVSSIS
jgi:hypothetical protein